VPQTQPGSPQPRVVTPADLIAIADPAVVLSSRAALIDFIWKGRGFPAMRQPDQIDNGIIDHKYDNLENLDRIDRLTTMMDFGVNSIAYHFIPRESNGKLAIYHQGHDGSFEYGIDTIDFLLQNGYAVLAFSMPLLGANSEPTVQIGDHSLLLQYHDNFYDIDSDNFSGIHYFLEPVAAGLNYALTSYSYSSALMVGISGGGWTTTMYAAIDPRIKLSFPVAGSLPAHLRARNDYGDYEQEQPDFYKLAGYLDLYLLGSVGTARKQLQILNRYDPCCFASDGMEPAILAYRDALGERLGSIGLGGQFDVYFDASHHEHEISDLARWVISRELHGPIVKSAAH
jgi:pimeloyl-ACP methyl ester carboxylesterase